MGIVSPGKQSAAGLNFRLPQEDGGIEGGGRRTSYRRAIHNLKLGDRLALVVLVGRGARRLAADDGELHVLDLDAHQQEVDLADDDVLQVVPV